MVVKPMISIFYAHWATNILQIMIEYADGEICELESVIRFVLDDDFRHNTVMPKIKSDRHLIEYEVFEQSMKEGKLSKEGFIDYFHQLAEYSKEKYQTVEGK